MTLRDYQSTAVDNLERVIAEGSRAPLLVAPTGAGKTFMLCELVKRRDCRVAWFAHRRELVSQAVASLARHGIVAGDGVRSPGAPVQVMTVQSALASGSAPDADLVVLDEAHHYAADDWGRLPAAYPIAPIVGATATPERGDGRPLSGLFDRIVVAATPKQLAERGVLTPCDVIGPHKPLKPGQVARAPADAYGEFARGRKAVVFAPRLDAAERFASEFAGKGIRTAVVHGALARQKRDAALSAFASGHVRVLVNVYVLTEGWDCPDVECVILARRFNTPGQYIQAVGRGIRAAPGKERCLLLDLTGSAHIHGHPLADRDYSLDGAPITLSGQSGAVYCPVCGAIVAGRCERCGREPEPKDVIVTNDPLQKFAHLQVDSESRRAERLARWISEAVGRGHKWQSAL
jgi:superfamily II DNA or RNA helicase